MQPLGLHTEVTGWPSREAGCPEPLAGTSSPGSTVLWALVGCCFKKLHLLHVILFCTLMFAATSSNTMRQVLSMSLFKGKWKFAS